MTEEKSPVLAGRALDKHAVEKALLHRQTWTRRQLMLRIHLSHAHHHKNPFQQTTNIAPPPHAGFGVLTRSSFSLILAGVSFLT